MFHLFKLSPSKHYYTFFSSHFILSNIIIYQNTLQTSQIIKKKYVTHFYEKETNNLQVLQHILL